MRCAVDGCRPVCSLICFSDTGSWCAASMSSSANVRSSTWIVGVCWLVACSSGCCAGSCGPILHRGSAIEHSGRSACVAAVRAGSRRPPRRRCARRLPAWPGRGRRHSRRRPTGPARWLPAGRCRPGVQRKVARFSVSTLQQRRGRGQAARAEVPLRPAPARPPRSRRGRASTQGARAADDEGQPAGAARRARQVEDELRRRRLRSARSASIGCGQPRAGAVRRRR